MYIICFYIHYYVCFVYCLFVCLSGGTGHQSFYTEPNSTILEWISGKLWARDKDSADIINLKHVQFVMSEKGEVVWPAVSVMWHCQIRREKEINPLMVEGTLKHLQLKKKEIGYLKERSNFFVSAFFSLSLL